ncbi:uncharacterized protein LOC131613190 [Vicia villosa]|uniref:uncharacterized protein LOC131613190 n=1 Tax=Vicia villosa TaxID=3911 RepID=UPI00273AE6B9|nr:uncharacterized protein LOC131613190 [Vicia villosa]
MMQSCTEATTRSFWRDDGIDYSVSNSEGMSGGQISLWNSRVMEFMFSIRGNGYICIKVFWKENLYYICNVYSACVLSLKRELWKNLLDLKSRYTDGEWIIGGDFNAVKEGKERKWGTIGGCHTQWEEFSRFIEDIGLIDVSCKGKKFSWYSEDGKFKSRIGRFLISNNVLDSWGVVAQLIGMWDISDHCPVWLVTNREDWGPKPFKFNNNWFQHKELLEFVEREWKELEVYGIGDYVLKEKIEIVKR